MQLLLCGTLSFKSHEHFDIFIHAWKITERNMQSQQLRADYTLTYRLRWYSAGNSHFARKPFTVAINICRYDHRPLHIWAAPSRSHKSCPIDTLTSTLISINPVIIAQRKKRVFYGRKSSSFGLRLITIRARAEADIVCFCWQNKERVVRTPREWRTFPRRVLFKSNKIVHKKEEVLG